MNNINNVTDIRVNKTSEDLWKYMVSYFPKHDDFDVIGISHDKIQFFSNYWAWNDLAWIVYRFLTDECEIESSFAEFISYDIADDLKEVVCIHFSEIYKCGIYQLEKWDGLIDFNKYVEQAIKELY